MPATDLQLPLNKTHCNAMVNYLLCMTCQVNDLQAATGTSTNELLSRHCDTLLKSALKPEVWPNCEPKLGSFEKILTGSQSVYSNQSNYMNICTCLDILGSLLLILRKELVFVAFKPLQKSILVCMSCPNSKVIRVVQHSCRGSCSTCPRSPPLRLSHRSTRSWSSCTHLSGR